ncbi:universal stress protein [Actinacidiphila yeochonensis]|uniref:universal stress protein n=1 Tax=Actinacidiphila yeochonensis TaxID=89050 RepID=UPI0018E3E459|nr:universal stress protein [Actinacidiphila yeochonensis]
MEGFELGCDGPSVVVVGVDGSDGSWRALHYAVGLARRQRSTVLAVFAVTVALAPDGTPLGQGGWEAEAAPGLRDEVAELAREYGVSTEFVCCSGEPVLVLAALAAERRADAVVVGASRAFGRRLFGSKAVRAVRRVTCPITVVP